MEGTLTKLLLERPVEANQVNGRALGSRKPYAQRLRMELQTNQRTVYTKKGSNQIRELETQPGCYCVVPGKDDGLT